MIVAAFGVLVSGSSVTLQLSKEHNVDGLFDALRQDEKLKSIGRVHYSLPRSTYVQRFSGKRQEIGKHLKIKNTISTYM